MRKIALFAVVSILSACSSAPKETYERRAYEERERREAAVSRTLEIGRAHV